MGRHQLRNVALAIAAAEELHNQGTAQITPETIAQGIRQTHWPGRFQVVPATGDNPEYVLDVAHNPAGAWALRSTLSAAYRDLENGREITMVFGVMRDKAMREITEILFPIARHVIVTHASNPRSASPDEIRQAAARVAAGMDIAEADNVASALKQARNVAGPRRPDRSDRLDLRCRRSDANARRIRSRDRRVARRLSCPRNVLRNRKREQNRHNCGARKRARRTCAPMQPSAEAVPAWSENRPAAGPKKPHGWLEPSALVFHSEPADLGLHPDSGHAFPDLLVLRPQRAHPARFRPPLVVAHHEDDPVAGESHGHEYRHR